MLLGKRVQIPIIPGVSPSSDSTPLDTLLFTNADKVRFQEGKLRKLNGWRRIFSGNDQDITGAARNIFSYRTGLDDTVTLIGTNTRLYAYFPLNGPYFYNITPLQTTTIDIPNAFSTEYNASDPVQVLTTAGSAVVSLFIPNHFEMNNLIQISSVSGGPYNGIPASSFNGTFPVTVNSNQQITITLPSAAITSGYIVVEMTWASSYLYVNYPDNGLPDGDRVKILASTSVGNIPANSINIEHIITNVVDTNNFIIQTDTIATSSVTAGGGSATTIQTQIPEGLVDQNYGFGYGGGYYGANLYGIGQANTSNDNVQYPRIWSMDNINGNVILTPGDPETSSTDNLYLWQNDINTAPVLVSSLAGASNAPLGNKWVYVSNNCAVTFGAAGVLNAFTASDQVSAANPLPINWSPGASTYAYATILAQATALISQAKSRNFDLLFTQDEVYYAEFVLKPDIWFFRELFKTDGIIAPKARAIIEDAVFWMGGWDFYVFDGYTVNVLPNCTVKRYVFDNINKAQSFKCFAFANVAWSEVWFFYPAGQDLECNNYVIYNYKEGHWTTGTLSRSAAEERINVNQTPLLIQSQITSTFPIPNSISTYFFNLSDNPITTTNDSTTVAVTIYSDAYLQVGDLIYISNATGVGGIPDTDINGKQTITSVITETGYGSGLYGFGLYGSSSSVITTITFTAATTATSAASGGGNTITVGTQILGVSYSGANILSVGQTVTIAEATAIDGFTAQEVNVTGPIRYATSNYFEIDEGSSTAFSTSDVVNGGGSAAVLLVNTACCLFEHETGLNDYNNDFNIYTDPWNDQFIPMLSYAQTNYAQLGDDDGDGDNTFLIYSMYPDIIQQGNMALTVNVKEYAQDPYINGGTFVFTPTTRKVDPMFIGRQRQYIFTSNVLDGNFLMGRLYEEVAESTPR